MIRALLHIVMSALILVSSLGMTINLHYCGDELYDIALNRSAHSCCEPGMQKHHCHQETDSGTPHRCNDETVRTQSTGDYFISGFTFDFRDFHSFDLFLTDLVADLVSEEHIPEQYSVLHFKIPPPQAVILSQIQSFLI